MPTFRVDTPKLVMHTQLAGFTVASFNRGVRWAYRNAWARRYSIADVLRVIVTNIRSGQVGVDPTKADPKLRRTLAAAATAVEFDIKVSLSTTAEADALKVLVKGGRSTEETALLAEFKTEIAAVASEGAYPKDVPADYVLPPATALETAEAKVVQETAALTPAPWTPVTWTGELLAFSFTAGSKCAAGKSAAPVSTTTKAFRYSATSSCISVMAGSPPTLQNFKQTCAAGDSSMVQQSCDSEYCTTCDGTPMRYNIEEVGSNNDACLTTATSGDNISFMSGAPTTFTGDASATFAPCLAPAATASADGASFPVGAVVGGVAAAAAIAAVALHRAKRSQAGATTRFASTPGVSVKTIELTEVYPGASRPGDNGASDSGTI